MACRCPRCSIEPSRSRPTSADDEDDDDAGEDNVDEVGGGVGPTLPPVGVIGWRIELGVDRWMWFRLLL